MKKIKRRHVLAIEPNGSTAIVIRRRRRFSAREWVAENPARRSLLLQCDPRYRAVLRSLAEAKWDGDTAEVQL